MASTVWKGHLTFGLVSIPIKLARAARTSKVSFRQLHGPTGSRVRHLLVAESEPAEDSSEESVEISAGSGSTTAARSAEAVPFVVRAARSSYEPAASAPEPPPREIPRSQIVKGYEYAKDQYITLSREELAQIVPRTAREMQILEFVKLESVDPIYFETSYYVSPDKGGERAYSLLFEALRQSTLVGLAQLALRNREHVVVVRPGRHGLVLHTMFYETEIRQQEEYRADTSAVSKKELELALLLIRNLEADFEPGKYRDAYREKLETLIQAKVKGEQTTEAVPPQPASIVNIMEALQRSLESTARVRKPPAKETPRRQSGKRPGTKRR